MFYTEDISSSYRLGDIVRGYFDVIPTYREDKGVNKISIDIEKYEYFSIITPCCSIENDEAIITPLKKLQESFFLNPYLVNDFTKINFPMTKKEAVGDEIYNQFSPEKRLIYDNEGPHFEFADRFIYMSHDLLPEYLLEYKRKGQEKQQFKTRFYMISFKDAVRIRCKEFSRSNKNCKKTLEISPGTRKSLRDKISNFYARVPDEDLPYIKVC